MTRRDVLKSAAALAVTSIEARAAEPGPTKFQLGCMTITYSQFPFERALKGIAAAGYKYAGWGTTHKDQAGNTAQVIEADAPAGEARRLAQLCRDQGLQPVMMFSQVYVAAPDSVKVHTQRIEQAAAAEIPFLLTFGRIEKSGAGDRETWVRNLKQLGPVARDHGVTLVIKQHGGATATGRDCSRIIGEVADDSVKMCYDAGNVLDYESVNPLSDI
jgi:sugar phosphate isomerase/epimerase